MTLLNITSWRNNGSKQLHEKIKTKFKVNDKIKLLNFQIFLPLTRGGVAGQLRFFYRYRYAIYAYEIQWSFSKWKYSN